VLTHVEVRNLAVSDLEPLAQLCVAARGESALGAQVCVAESEKISRQIATFAQLEGGDVIVAEVEGQLVGFAMIRLVSPGAFIDQASYYIEALYVASSARRRGVGHNLLAEVAERAAAQGIQDIYSLPLPGARGVQRFLARLGFAPAASHRVVSLSTLQRNLDAELKRNRRGTGRTIEDLIARRRRARTETNSGPVDLRAFQAEFAARQSLDPRTAGASAESAGDYHARNA